MSLLKESRSEVEPGEFMIALKTILGGPGQYKNLASDPNRLYLPLVGSAGVIASYTT